MNQGANPFIVNGFSFTDSITVLSLNAGIYTYTVTDANNCETTLDFTLYDPPLLTAGDDVVHLPLVLDPREAGLGSAGRSEEGGDRHEDHGSGHGAHWRPATLGGSREGVNRGWC